VTCVSPSPESISLLVEGALDKAYEARDEWPAAPRIEKYRREHASDLAWFVARYAADPLVGPLVEIPELVAILELLESDPTGLVVHWPHELPRHWLDTVAELWGAPL
jgi:hypothetical protein